MTQTLDVQDALQSWHEGFVRWAGDVGVTLPEPLSQGLPAEAGPPRHQTILFGEHLGSPLWLHWRDIPGAAARDALLQMVATQTDCHMASVEMQRNLLDAAPGPQDAAALRLIVEENLGNAAALGALLIRHFPKRGAIAAAQLLDRRSWLQTRVLNAFNQPLRHWLDLTCFEAFVSLCARFALESLAVGGFAPVAATAEQLFEHHRKQSHVGVWGLARVVEAGQTDPALLQKYVNRWVSLALDLFGWDRSETAALAYRAGIKGRVHERERSSPPEDPTQLNGDARMRWLYEVEVILAQLNRQSHREPPLRVPTLTANRTIVDDRPPTARGGAVGMATETDQDWPVPTPADDELVQRLASG